MRVVKCKVSHNFMSSVFKNEIDFSDSELPRDTKVVGIKGNLKEEWFWIYFKSREFMDIDLDYDQIPEVTLWFGRRRDNAQT